MTDVRVKDLRVSCKFGMTMQDLVFHDIDLEEFTDWICGQTVVFCEGSQCDEAHCTVIYQGDVEKFLATR